MTDQEPLKPVERQLKWDKRFLELARFVANWSKDPSTKTGAVIVDNNRHIVSMGYNGFPTGVANLEDRYGDREMKYKIVVHCERNAIIFAKKLLDGCTLYTWPFMSCCPCGNETAGESQWRFIRAPKPGICRALGL